MIRRIRERPERAPVETFTGVWIENLHALKFTSVQENHVICLSAERISTSRSDAITSQDCESSQSFYRTLLLFYVDQVPLSKTAVFVI